MRALSLRFRCNFIRGLAFDGPAFRGFAAKSFSKAGPRQKAAMSRAFNRVIRDLPSMSVGEIRNLGSKGKDLASADSSCEADEKQAQASVRILPSPRHPRCSVGLSCIGVRV